MAAALGWRTQRLAPAKLVFHRDVSRWQQDGGSGLQWEFVDFLRQWLDLVRGHQCWGHEVVVAGGHP